MQILNSNLFLCVFIVELGNVRFVEVGQQKITYAATEPTENKVFTSPHLATTTMRHPRSTTPDWSYTTRQPEMTTSKPTFTTRFPKSTTSN